MKPPILRNPGRTQKPVTLPALPAARSFAEELENEQEALRRRILHHTRARDIMSLDEAIKHSKAMEGPPPSNGDA